MKNIIYLLVSAIFMSHAAYAQKITVGQVPVVVASALDSKFPKATKATWELEKSVYEASFKLNGKEISACFDTAGTWLETETVINPDDLPYAVRATLKKDFDGWKIKEAAKIESVKHGNTFEAELEKDEESYEVLMTTDGQVLNKTLTVKEKEEKD